MFDRVPFWTNPQLAPEKIKSEKFYKYCLPEFYLHLDGFTNIINSAIYKYVDKSWSILDIGCGTGRGLVDLYRHGYHNLTGIEINPSAITLGLDTFPELHNIMVMNNPIEEILIHLKMDYDVVYSVGCLMHLPPSLDWVIDRIALDTKKMIITAENEKEDNMLKWSRDYKMIFEVKGWEQIEKEKGSKYPPISDTTVKRVFKKGK